MDFVFVLFVESKNLKTTKKNEATKMGYMNKGSGRKMLLLCVCVSVCVLAKALCYNWMQTQPNWVRASWWLKIPNKTIHIFPVCTLPGGVYLPHTYSTRVHCYITRFVYCRWCILCYIFCKWRMAWIETINSSITATTTA